MRTSITLLIISMYHLSAFAQNNETIRIRDHRLKNEQEIINEYVSFLSIPNTAADTGGLQKNAAFIMEMMRKRNIQQIQLLNGTTKNIPPVVYGEVITPGANKTIIFYAHYDGQPVNPLQWAKGLEPFTPKLFSGPLDNGGSSISFPADKKNYDPEWRIYARSSSDDKAGVAAILNAYDAITKTGLPVNCNIKFFFEGEEEAGSPHLREIIRQNAALLQSDIWIICDGPVHQSGKKQIVFGVRGDTHLDLTVYGAKRPLHSGHYGNWAPNPAMMLAKLLASMKDDNGKVTIKGFYDDVTPLTAAEKKALQEIPAVDEQLKNELGIAAVEMKGKTLSEAINLPSLNINGIQSANTGRLATNIIPTTATAVIDLRLVLGNDYKRQQEKVIAHIKQMGYTVLDHEPTDTERKLYPKLIKVIAGEGTNAQRTSMTLLVTKQVIAAVKGTTNEQVVLMPTLGGSLPLDVLENILHAITVVVPIANHDNNQHAENENIRLQNFWNGIETMAALMLMKL